MSNFGNAAPTSTQKNGTAARPRFETKAEWAKAKGDEYSAQANAMRYESSGGHYGRACRKYEGIANLQAQARRYYAMAETFKRQGK